MLRSLAELDRLDADERLGAGRRRRARLLSLPVVATLALTGGLVWVRQAAQEPIDHIAAIVSVTDRPRLPDDAMAGRLIAAPIAPVGSGGFTFMADNHRGPAAYDPCRPLHLVVNHELAPPGADDLLEAAIAQLAPVTGLQLVVDGTTDETAAENRPSVDRERYGNRWAPVLVAWTDERRDPRLGEAVGIGGSQVLPDSTGRYWNITGMVHLNGPVIGEMLATAEGEQQAVAVVVHELVHVLGLGHADIDGQVMTVNGTGQTILGDGDLRGLASLADVPCNREF